MSRRLVAVEWGTTQVGVASGHWARGVLSELTVESVARDDGPALHAALARGAAHNPSGVGVVVSPAAVARRVLELPFRSRRAISEVLPIELRSRLPADPGSARIVWHTVDVAGAGCRVSAALVPERLIETITATLASAGLTPTRIDLAPLPAWQLVGDPTDTALVVADTRDPVLGLTIGREPALMRSLHAHPADRDGFVDEIVTTIRRWNGTPSRLLVAGDAAGDWLHGALAEACRMPVERLAPVPAVADGADGAPVRAPALVGELLALGRGASVPLAIASPDPVSRGRRRRLWALGAAAAMLALTNLALERYDLARRARGLEAALHTVAARALPQATIVAPHTQLRAAAATALPLERGEPLLDRLRAIADAVPPGLDLGVRELAIESEGVTLRGEAPTFETVEALRRSLARTPRLTDVVIDEMRARIDGGGVDFAMRATWRAWQERPS